MNLKVKFLSRKGLLSLLLVLTLVVVSVIALLLFDKIKADVLYTRISTKTPQVKVISEPLSDEGVIGVIFYGSISKAASDLLTEAGFEYTKTSINSPLPIKCLAIDGCRFPSEGGGYNSSMMGYSITPAPGEYKVRATLKYSRKVLGKTYYYSIYGSWVNFTIPETPLLKVETLEATEKTANTAKINGNGIFLPIDTNVGLVWRNYAFEYTTDPSYANPSKIFCLRDPLESAPTPGCTDYSKGPFSYTLTGLKSNTVYYYRAYIDEWGVGKVYGNWLSFKLGSELLLDCPKFTWDSHISNSNPACDRREDGSTTAYWRLATDPATNKFFSSGIVRSSGAIHLGGKKAIRFLAVALARPIMIETQTSISLKICASDSLKTDGTLSTPDNCSNFTPSKYQEMQPEMSSPPYSIYYSMQPAAENPLTGEYITLEFTLSSSNPDVTPAIGPNNMRLMFY